MAPAAWVIPGAVLWFVILLLPWRPWSTRERLEGDSGERPEGFEPEGFEPKGFEPKGFEPKGFEDVSVLVPARDEAAVIGRTLRALARQGSGLHVVVVDDQSTDGTAAVARKSGIDDLTLVTGTPVPPGWSGKVWALEQGRAHIVRRYTLLLDADIELAPGMLAALRTRLRESRCAMVSLMAELPTQSFWERLLIPAFIYFFKLLYPFRLSASPQSRIAAAAGGCVLLETRMLEAIGGFESLRGALIDDCSLAAQVKRRGGGCWIGLTHGACSVRARTGLRDIWQMVVRTAFTQLRYSPLLLVLCTVLMVATFVTPPLALALGPSAPTRVWAAGALMLMAATYLPTLRFYGVAPRWTLALPLAGVLYLAMTWHSAIRYWCGTRSRWKGREYASLEGS